MTTQTEKWWIFSGWNMQEQIGWGTEKQAEAFCDRLNLGREINLYAATEADEDRYAELDGRDDGVNLADELAND